MPTGGTPLLATHRFQIPITCLGLLHHMHLLTDLQPGGTGPSGLLTVPFAPFTAVNAEDSIDAWLTLMAPMFSAATASFGGVDIQEFTAGTYVTLTTHSSTVVPTSGTATQEASQGTLFFYTNFTTGVRRKKWTFALHESVDAGPYKDTSFGTLFPRAQAIVTAVTAPTTGLDGGAWIRQRGGGQIKSWASAVYTLNRRTRRRRALL